MDNVTTHKIYTSSGSNHLEVLIGLLFTLDFFYISFVVFLILHYAILHTRTNWILYNWFLTAIICLSFNAITFLTPTPMFNVFLYVYCQTTVDIIISNIYFMLMLSFDCIVDNFTERSFKLLIYLIWTIAILQYIVNYFINIRFILISLCQISIFIILVKYLFLMKSIKYGKTTNYPKKIRFATIGNFLLVYLGGFTFHTIYFGDLPNENNFFQLFHYNVIVTCPIYTSIYLILLDKNFYKAFLHAIKCGKDPIVAVELSEIHLDSTLQLTN